MTTISSLGAGSGLDLEGLVTKLMTVEQAPLTVIDNKISSYNTKISALGALKSAVTTLQTAAKALAPSIGQTAQQNLATYSATLADTSVGTATADSAASSSAGDYSLTVVQTARTDRLTFAANPTLTAGTTLNIAVGTSSVSVSITAGMTLGDLRDAINSSSGGATATLIGGTQLILTSNTSGGTGLITVSGDAGFAWNPNNTGAAVGISQSTDSKGRDAQIQVNGILLTSTSNTFTDAVDGVDITLKSGTAANTSTTLTVSADTSTKVTADVKAFVDAYNSFISLVKQYGYYDADTKTAGTLQGDYALRTMQSRLYSQISSTPAGVTGSITSLSNLGISVQSDGKLSIDSTKLSNAVSSGFTNVSNYLAALGKSVDTASDGLISSDGLITNATSTINSRIDDAETRRTALEARLTVIEARYRKQFSALDTLIASMQSTSTYLTQQLASLASLTSSSN
jgi:flagellar hook-associated protein 2